MSLALQPSGSWVRLDIATGSPDTVRLLAMRPWPDPPTYYGGQKTRGVTRWGDVVRALSDRSGSPVVSRFSVDCFDADGDLRDLLASLTYLTGQDLTFYLASERAHDLAVLDDPWLGFRGQIVKASPRPNRHFTFDAESRIGTRYGPFNLDSPVLTRSFGDDIATSPSTGDFPNIPREFIGKAVPFLWGELSDEGTVTGAGDDVATGMAIPTFCGFLPGETPTYALAPTNLVIVVTGSGTTSAKRAAVSTITANGETLPTIIDVPAYPEPATTSHYADWTWTDPNAPGVAIAFPIYLDNLDGTGWHRLDTMNNGGTYVDPETAYNDGQFESDDHWKMLRPGPVSVNTAVIGTTQEFFCLLGHEGTITKIYASDLQSTPAYLAVDASEIGTGNYFDLGPDDTGYLVTINGHDYWGFLARGPKAEAHKNGTMPFRVNLCGWHDESSPNLLIDRAAWVYQDVFTQLQGGPSGEGFQSGARLTIPSFRSSPLVPILQSTTFDAVQDLTISEMGTTDGCLATVYLDSFDTTWRQFMEGMNRTFFWDTGENHHGQSILAMMPSTVDPTDGPIFREFTHVLRVENAGEPEPDQIENVIRYQFDRHPIDGVYRSGVLTLRDDTSIAGYGGERASGSVIDLPYTRDPETAAYVMGRYLADRATAPQYPAVVVKLHGAVGVEIGTQFQVQHSDCGDDPILVYCREHTLSHQGGFVRLSGRLRLTA